MKVIKIKNTPYQVSDSGMIWNVTHGLTRVAPYKIGNILYVDLYVHGGKRRLSEVILEAFGVLGAGKIIYKDGNTENCQLNNLKWSRTLEQEREILKEKLRNIEEQLDNS